MEGSASGGGSGGGPRGGGSRPCNPFAARIASGRGVPRGRSAPSPPLRPTMLRRSKVNFRLRRSKCRRACSLVWCVRRLLRGTPSRLVDKRAPTTCPNDKALFTDGLAETKDSRKKPLVTTIVVVGTVGHLVRTLYFGTPRLVRTSLMPSFTLHSSTTSLMPSTAPVPS
ncbi:hypothetical protein BHE74_00002732 [Ensete ventricosum]|nr:hypothetical protein GW17_00056754 [Ensete ventricosum]RWW88389.1 hypothetical protein BHE74_00002732 [Ensete ventricosum]